MVAGWPVMCLLWVPVPVVREWCLCMSASVPAAYKGLCSGLLNSRDNMERVSDYFMESLVELYKGKNLLY